VRGDLGGATADSVPHLHAPSLRRHPHRVG
jgi:hypothetical protein